MSRVFRQIRYTATEPLTTTKESDRNLTTAYFIPCFASLRFGGRGLIRVSESAAATKMSINVLVFTAGEVCATMQRQYGANERELSYLPVVRTRNLVGSTMNMSVMFKVIPPQEGFRTRKPSVAVSSDVGDGLTNSVLYKGTVVIQSVAQCAQ